jgi:hypothetical protein
MPTEYIVQVVGENERDSILVKFLTIKIIELEKLHEAKMQVVETKRI